MTRRTTFEGDKAQERFTICWMAVHDGRVHMINDAQGKQSRDDRQKDLAVLQVLKPASTEVGAKRVVTPGAQIELKQPHLDRLIALIDRIPWDTSKIEAVEDTLDWLAASDKVDG